MLLRNNQPRRGVILIVVLALLTLFAIVGLSFVLYAQAEAESSRLHREDKTLRQVLESPDRMWSYALSKLLYDDYDDATGVYSALRGYSLARSMYGFDNYIAPYLNTPGNPPAYVPNQTPFNGTGRNVLNTVVTPYGVAGLETQLINYTYFPNDPVTAGQIHDPERLGWRANLSAPPNPITGGFNVPYTYPDLNNMFLGAINAGGQVLMPSFHRPWLFGGIDPTTQQPTLPSGAPNPNFNQNWTNAQGKYLMLRPRPFDHSAAFPYPEDAGGDVKNLYWLPGGNDSIWVDLGYPVQVAPDGRKYKPLFAFFITDLDNRINLNVHGNMRGQTPPPTAAGFSPGAPFYHVSNQGWGKWEVNLGAVLNSQNPGALSLNNTVNPPTINGPEWLNLFLGVGNPTSSNYVTIRGKYGWDFFPDDPSSYTSPTGNQAAPGTLPHVYGQVDYDGCQQTFTPTLPIQLPGIGGYGQYNAFPAFLAGYDNGGGGTNGNAERVNHPLIYDFFRPFSDPVAMNWLPPAQGGTLAPPDFRPAIDDRAFPVSEMKGLLNGNLAADPNVTQAFGQAPQMAANPNKSELGTLLPFNFNDPQDIAGSLRRRSLVTTLSMDMSLPGMMPWMWNADGTNAAGNPVGDIIQGGLAGDDPVMSRPPRGIPSNFPDPNGAATNRTGPIPANSEFNVPGSPALFPQSNWRAAMQAVRQLVGRIDLSQALPAYPASPTYRFDVDAPNGPIFTQYVQAHTARMTLAQDIYRTLRKLAGVQAIPVVDQIAPTETELMPRRWLAQLAVNIVDFIDSDNISTPLNFYPDNEVPLPNWLAAGGNLALVNTSTSNSYPVGPTPPGTTPATSSQELYRYWVFGTELPRLVLNEVFAEYTPGMPTVANSPTTVNVYAEFFNPLPALAPAAGQGPWDPSDASNVILFVPAAGAGATPYAPYRAVIAAPPSAGGAALPGGPLTPRTSPPGPVLPPTTTVGNDNVLGTPDQIRTMTVDDAGTWLPPGVTPPPYVTAGAFSLGAAQVNNPAGNNGTLVTSTLTPPMSLPPQGYLLLGPGTNTPPNVPSFAPDANATIPAYVGNGTVAVPTAAMTYKVLASPPAVAGQPPVWKIGTTTVYDNTLGINVLLRRLSNPSMPPNVVPAGPMDPTFNPYFTADFMEGIVPNAGVAKSTTEHSIGKLQPYASANVPNPQTLAIQKTAANPYHTLGLQNNNNGNPPPPYDWLVHLDRQLVSPMELLNVSGYHPHELTHRFISATPDPTDPLSPKFGHRVHWFDQTTRLYRLFEFLEVTDRAYGVTSLGRRPGKININTVWDQEILNALLDPQTSNYFNAADVARIYVNLVNGRTPGYVPALTANPPQPLLTLGPNDRPFSGMGSGNIPYNDPFYPNGASTFYPFAAGIGDTFLRVSDMTQIPPSPTGSDPTGQGRPDLPRLFENPRSLIFNAGPPASYIPDPLLGHPYLRFEPLNKVYNNLTSRSNVFGVWCTIGYFEVVNDQTRPVTLGAEIGKAAGTNVRHRFFSVVDRTEMVIAPNLINSANGPGGTLVNPNNPLLGPGQAWVELDQTTPNPPIVTYNYPNLLGLRVPASSSQPPIAWNITTGSVLILDRGTRNEEWVQVTQMWPPGQNPPQPPGMPAPTSPAPAWIQANFIRPHNPGFSITQPGNPGPQPPIDVRDYQHAPVVPVSVTVEPGPR